MKQMTNPSEFDRRDLWQAAVTILKEEFDGNSDIRAMLRRHAQDATETIHHKPRDTPLKRRRRRGDAAPCGELPTGVTGLDPVPEAAE